MSAAAIDPALVRFDKDPTLSVLSRQVTYKTYGFYDGILDNDDGPMTQASALAFAKSLTPTTPLKGRAVNAAGIELVKHFESCLKPLGAGKFASYADPGYGWSVATIGWGTVIYPDGRKVKKGDVITQAQADEYLAWEVAQKAEGVESLVKVKVNDDMFAALVSFAYNAGTGALSKSTLLRLLNSGDYTGASKEFAKWNKSNGKALKGLTRRRASEKNLFLSIDPAIVQ